MVGLKSGQGRGKGKEAANSRAAPACEEVSISVIVDRLKAAADVAGQFCALNIGSDMQEKARDLQATLRDVLPLVIAADENQKKLLNRINWLKERLAAFQSWESERGTYELARFDPGVFAYRRKPSNILINQPLSAEYEHLLCSNCFDNRRRSILQSTPKIERRYQVHMCPECKNEYAFYYERNGINV